MHLKSTTNLDGKSDDWREELQITNASFQNLNVFTVLYSACRASDLLNDMKNKTRMVSSFLGLDRQRKDVQ